jgi:UDP-glucose-4-epimerase GalE
MTEILVTGGAGYIGSTMCKHLKAKGYLPVVIDSLITGHRQAIKWGPFFEGSLEDSALLEQVFSRHRPAAVMHFAASCYVGESVHKPYQYYRNNVAATINLLGVMQRHGISNLIFSSSCATYGEPEETPMTEKHPQKPINPYGRSKLMVEQIIKDMRTAGDLRYISLRYFNAAGADPDGEVGEDHRPETHIIPLVLQTALGRRDAINIYGDDYPTRDGTCIRDYIHINDLAQAHLLALEKLLNGHPGDIYNLGNGGGYSVREVIETARSVTGRPIPVVKAGRRAGDPGELVSASEKARTELRWKPQFPDLRDIIATAWEWHRSNPDGYGD